MDRIMKTYRKPILVSAGNDGPSLSTTSLTSEPSGVISVGGYIHRDTWAANFGTAVRQADNLHFIAARGPSLDGRLKPDLVAPLCCLAATPSFDRSSPTKRMVLQNSRLPFAYAVATGTSFSAPMATGATALLISAAKQQHIPYDAERIHRALTSSARFLEGYGANE